MALARPTLQELTDRIQQDLVSRLGLVGPVLRRSLVYVFARVLAGAAHGLYGFLSWLSRQALPDTADAENLVRIAEVFAVPQTAAGYARASVELDGTGGEVGQGAVLVRSDGAEYTVDADVSVVSGPTAAQVTAVLAGASYTLTLGTVLTLQAPLPQVSSTSVVTASTVDGVDEGDIENLRERVLERLRTPPHGGADPDYVAWAKEVPGVTRVWVDGGGLGPGTVVVRFMRDAEIPPFPSTGTQAQATVSFTGAGGEVGQGTVLVRLSDGAEYTLDADVPGVPDTGTITAVYPGAQYTLTPGTILAFAAGPPLDVDPPVTVGSSDVAGTDGEVQAVEAYLDELRPVTAEVRVFAPIDYPVAFTAAVVPDTAAVRAAVEAELQDLFQRVAEPGGTVYLSAIRTAVGTAAGLTDYTLTVPAADVAPGAGELASLGVVTWA